jgi:kynurenine formamidase
MTSANVLASLAGMLASGGVEVVDCTGVLGPDTPLLKLPPDFAKDTPKIEIHTISNYDQNGPFWAWNWLKVGEHSGTHFDAPHHWITPVNVLDFAAECGKNADFLLTIDHVKAWEAKHGAINAGEWVVLRSDWDKRSHDENLFLNADETGPHTPGPTAEVVQYLLSKGIVGWGTQCIGTDAGQAGGMTPPYPAHNLLHKNNCFGLASLANLDKLPAKGAILIAAPLKIKNGTGSPIRALALVPRG